MERGGFGLHRGGRKINTAKLTIWLNKRGMSYRALAAAVGVTPAAISQYFHGMREPGRETLMKISRVTGIPIDDLVRKGEKNAQ